MAVTAVALAATGAAQAATPMQIISNPAGPIKQIFLGNELGAQIDHIIDTGAYQIYPPRTTPADYGTLVVIDDVLYAPNFAQHGGTATSQIGTYTAFTPVSQTAPTGAGTLADPYKVVTVVKAGDTGIGISQADSYVAGQDTYRSDITFSNTGAADKSILVYRAMDCYLGANDRGYGTSAGGTVSCSINPNNTPQGRVMSLIPLTGGNQYEQNIYSNIWRQIGTHQPFTDTCVQCASQVDNGIGISWIVTVPAGGTASLSHLTLFSPTGRLPLSTAKTVTPDNAAAGSVVSYTITVTNPNTAAVNLDTLVDTLPDGFSYVSGSSQDATTSNPAVAGQSLTWNGPLSVPANSNGSLRLTFQARVGAAVASGTYTNRVQGTATGYTVQDSGDTAPVTVIAGSARDGVQAVPTLSEWALLLVMAGVAAIAGRGLRRPRA